MSVDGRFLHFLTKELHNSLYSGRVQKISQLGKTDFLLNIRAHNQNRKLYISLSTSLARINLTKENYSSDYTPGGFCMFLRKHLEGSFVEKFKTLQNDRIVEMTFNATNEIGDRVTIYLIMEMFSRYTNLILLNSDRIIINAYKHISPFESIDRTIINGSPYKLPEDNKLNPDDYKKIEKLFQSETTYKDIIQNIRGLSPIFAKYLLKQANYNHQKLFELYKKVEKEPVNPTISLGNKTEFYYYDIFDKNQVYFSTLSELLDFYFNEASSLERVKQIHKYLFSFVKREYKRKKNKLEKLSSDYNKALENDIYRIKGDLLISNQHKVKKGDKVYQGFSYELNKDIEVELNRLLTPIENANKYYTKYKKLKKAVHYIDEQIEITKREIEYFNDLILQIQDMHSLNDLYEIQDELIANGFLPKKKKNEKKKKKPNFDIYVDSNNIEYYIGKNNIQNNYLTHKFAKKEYWWFHVKNQTGSHVVIGSFNDLNESTIRLAANLAVIHSKSKDSSSVPVDYTKIKYIKKIPGMLGSFVSYTNQKTIYIDPDPSIIKDLLKKARQ